MSDYFLQDGENTSDENSSRDEPSLAESPVTARARQIAFAPEEAGAAP